MAMWTKAIKREMLSFNWFDAALHGRSHGVDFFSGPAPVGTYSEVSVVTLWQTKNILARAVRRVGLECRLVKNLGLV